VLFFVPLIVVLLYRVVSPYVYLYLENTSNRQGWGGEGMAAASIKQSVLQGVPNAWRAFAAYILF
jgi:hypothetical protein